MKTLSVLILLATATIPAFAGVTTPEPSTMVLIGGGLGAVILIGRWNQSRKKK